VSKRGLETTIWPIDAGCKYFLPPNFCNSHIPLSFSPRYGKQYIVDRVMFGKHIFEATRQLYGDQITWHWGHALQQVDFDQR